MERKQLPTNLAGKKTTTHLTCRKEDNYPPTLLEKRQLPIKLAGKKTTDVVSKMGTISKDRLKKLGFRTRMCTIWRSNQSCQDPTMVSIECILVDDYKDIDNGEASNAMKAM